jgi:N-acetylated-alpha-linked acidic dipeptidase
MVKENRYVLAADPTKKLVAPTTKEEVPFINFSSLQNAVTKLEKSTSTFSELYSARPNAAQLNNLLFQSERKLLANGLPRRPWYKHTIYAPGFYTGYGVKTLPGVREAIEQRNFPEAQQQIEIAAKSIEAFNEQVEAANKILMTK